MTRLWSLSVAFAVLLCSFASASLRAQAPAGPLPSDPAETAGSSQTGIILGTVTDLNDSPVPGATVALQGSDAGDIRSVTTNESGFFEIRDVEPGLPYKVIIRAAGFSEWDSPAVTLEPGQSKILDVSKLQIQEVQTLVKVTPETSEQIAIEQVKTEEKQRVLGIIPGFYAVYDPNPAPLTGKLRISLALKLSRDPFTLAGVAVLAGIGQATNHPAYVQGAKGYAERFGASYANSVSDFMFDGVILPAILHQDPRYFYKGKGSTQSRALHAFASLLIAKGDNGRLQPNYSSVGGDLASAAISNLYYPKSSRGMGLVLQGFAINSAIHAGVRLLDEFFFRPSAAAAYVNH
jgi:carboxypeptidase family protein